MLIVLSGPSGVGKDAVLERMKEQGKPYYFTVTATTRPPRDSERDGVHYVFVSDETFREMIDGGELLEWAEVHGYLYGVPKSQVVKALGEGKDVIIKPDVQGAATIKELVPDALLVFLAPPTMEELERRLDLRKTEAPDALHVRIQNARAEMKEAGKFDHVVVNHRDRLDETVEEIEGLIASERTRSSRTS